MEFRIWDHHVKSCDAEENYLKACGRCDKACDRAHEAAALCIS
ncbi:hypothetical protein CCACVL1_04196 [Corchorus capsularis]|uniref:Uncharacterized protein n=1 Tax=Corchorus capsularis TaxID=210143 RepID=A0A1R3JUL7_COCAP|nr:hypothetical protein CCACVL1_04196 [Corchorus capsularis]